MNEIHGKLLEIKSCFDARNSQDTVDSSENCSAVETNRNEKNKNELTSAGESKNEEELDKELLKLLFTMLVHPNY